jgi:hypothetical protein
MKAFCTALLLLSLSGVSADSIRVESKGKPKPKKGPISEDEVRQALADWGTGLVSIAQAAVADRVTVATNVINSNYDYENGIVLFKPTLASKYSFRTTFEEALSYFIGGNPDYADEDGSGFATNPWVSVTWEVEGKIIPGEQALVMGYKLLDKADGSRVTAHFSMAFVRDKDTGIPQINLHHSSLPYVK